MNKVVESVQPAQIIIYQSNTYRKNLSSLYSENEPNSVSKGMTNSPAYLRFLHMKNKGMQESHASSWNSDDCKKSCEKSHATHQVSV